jgi:Flp pilus assembly protein CpaB
MSRARDSEQRASTFPLGLAAGAALGFALSVVLVGALGYLYMKRRERELRHYHGIPVVVASQDLPAGTLITFDLISQRSVPEQFVTASVVKPDNANAIVGQRIQAPVRTGDMLLWSQFEQRKLAPGLVAARDIPVGAKLTEQDMADRGMDPAMVTASFVTPPERPRVLGQTVTAAFREGDPILWTHFKDVPVSP